MADIAVMPTCDLIGVSHRVLPLSSLEMASGCGVLSPCKSDQYVCTLQRQQFTEATSNTKRYSKYASDDCSLTHLEVLTEFRYSETIAFVCQFDDFANNQHHEVR